MEASFRTNRQALAFAATIALLLGLPWLVSFARGGGRTGLYEQTPTHAGPYAFIERQVFREQGPIDVLAIGPSYLWAGFDAGLLERELSRVAGRPAVVLNLAGNWRGEEIYYLLARDLLARRKVGLVVFTMNLPDRIPIAAHPHPMSRYWVMAGDLPLREPGLGFRYQAQLSAETLIGGPRQLLTLLRPNRVGQDRYTPSRGAAMFRMGYLGAPFKDFHPPPPMIAPADLIGGRGAYRFQGAPLLPHESHNLKALAGVLRQHGVPTVIVHLPIYFGDDQFLHSEVMEERQDWRELFADSALVGIPPATLFAGMGHAEVRQLYYNSHLNANGARFFTRAIAPALLELHAKSNQN